MRVTPEPPVSGGARQRPGRQGLFHLTPGTDEPPGNEGEGAHQLEFVDNAGHDARQHLHGRRPALEHGTQPVLYCQGIEEKEALYGEQAFLVCGLNKLGVRG